MYVRVCVCVLVCVRWSVRSRARTCVRRSVSGWHNVGLPYSVFVRMLFFSFN